MKALQSGLVFVAALAGAAYGLIVSWEFTFGTIVPWLGISPQWQNLSGLLIWFFFVAEVVAGVYAVAFAACASILLLAVRFMVSLFRQPKQG